MADRSPILMSSLVMALKAASETTAVNTDTRMTRRAGIPKSTTPYTVVGMSAMITASISFCGVTPVKTCGLDERSRLFDGTLGLLLLLGAYELLADAETLDELDVRRADETAGAAFYAIECAYGLGLVKVGRLERHVEQCG